MDVRHEGASAPPYPGDAATALPAPADAARSRAVSGWLILLALGVTVLQHVGLTIEPIALNASLLVMLATLVALAFAGRLTMETPQWVSYAALASVLCLGTVVNANLGQVEALSLPSVALVLVAYLPLVFVMRPGVPHDVDARWMRRVMANVLLFCAGVGILQFGVQFVYSAPWMFDLGELLPPVLRSTSGYNTVYAMGDVIKANGFFYKEPSFFSIAMAFGLLLEIAEFKRPLRMLVMAVGLLVTYSGSGFIVLAVGLLYPLRAQVLLRLGALGLLGAVLWLTLGEVLNLEYTLSRLEEFTNPHTSGYQRYVAPVRLILDSAFDTPWTLWLGHGPGTMMRTGDTRFYLFHDPTFAKAVYEYGVLGLAGFIALTLTALRAAAVPAPLRAAAWVCWLGTGGFLLTPEILYLVMVFGRFLPVPSGAAVEDPAPRGLGGRAPLPAATLDLSRLQPRAR